MVCNLQHGQILYDIFNPFSGYWMIKLKVTPWYKSDVITRTRLTLELETEGVSFICNFYYLRLIVGSGVWKSYFEIITEVLFISLSVVAATVVVTVVVVVEVVVKVIFFLNWQENSKNFKQIEISYVNIYVYNMIAQLER